MRARRWAHLLNSVAAGSSGNTAPATISAIVKDANNNLLAGVPVLFQVTSGAIVPVQTSCGQGGLVPLFVVAGTTDATGLAQASVTTPGDPSNRAPHRDCDGRETATGKVTLNVSGSTLSLTGPNNVVLGNTGTCTVVLSDFIGARCGQSNGERGFRQK